MDGRVERGEWIVAVTHGGRWDPLSEKVDLWIASKRFCGDQVHVARCLEFVDLDEGATVSEPTLRLEVNAAQDLCLALLDAMRQAGVLPWATGEGEAAAVKVHLEDMRRLAFGERGDD